jgi:hypothetical protein
MTSRRVLPIVFAISVLVPMWSLRPASASCAVDDAALTLRQMIEQGETGEAAYDHLFIGRVRQIRDAGSEGGRVTVRLRVREVSVGDPRRWVGVSDWVEPPGVSSSVEFDFTRGGRYAVVARLGDRGLFHHNAPCGQTARLSAERFRALIQLSRRS